MNEWNRFCNCGKEFSANSHTNTIKTSNRVETHAHTHIYTTRRTHHFYSESWGFNRFFLLCLAFHFTWSSRNFTSNFADFLFFSWNNMKFAMNVHQNVAWGNWHGRKKKSDYDTPKTNDLDRFLYNRKMNLEIYIFFRIPAIVRIAFAKWKW